MYKTLRIKLNQDITPGRVFSFIWPTPQKYHAGDVITVIEASNLPDDSKIAYWVNQDGWEDDAYGFPVHKDCDFTILDESEL